MEREQDSRRRRERKVFILDPQPIVREGLTGLINGEPDLIFCDAVAGSNGVLGSLQAAEPEVLIFDFCLEERDGLELLKEIRSRHERLKVLIFSTKDEMVYAGRALRAGAQGYLMKDQPCKTILEAVRRLLAEEIYVSEHVACRLLQQLAEGSNGASTAGGAVDALSDRELEVFRLIGEGLTTREIARRLFLSVKTVETYQGHIKRKLALTSGHELRYFAIVSQQ